MFTWILLLRGINVGGRNKLPMKELVRDLQALGLEDVKTYIQSGNVVFRSSEVVSQTLGDEIAATIEDRHGFRPKVLVLSVEQLEKAIASNPFPDAASEPKSLHLFFLAAVPEAPDLEALEKVKIPSERFHLADQVFYLFAPDGIGRSKLAASTEKYLGVSMTARNWRTVRRLLDMANAHEA